MKANNEITANNAATNNSARMHSFMIIAGIVTAIICSLVLLKDFSATQLAGTREFKSINVSNTTIAEQAMSMIKVAF